MEEENKIVNEEIVPGQNVEVEKENNVPQEQKPKKNKGNILILVLFGLMAVCALVYLFVLKPSYEKDKKERNETNSETSEKTDTKEKVDEKTDIEEKVDEETNDEDDYTYKIPASSTDSEEIKIAKEKLNAANMLFKDSCDSDDLYAEEGTGSSFCYYDTLDNFNKNFYSVYSTQLQYEDVYGKYDGSEDYTGTKDYMFSYVVKDNKVYHDSCTMGGEFESIDSFNVNSATDDRMEISYKVNYGDLDEKYSKDGKMVLVKESGDWKILKATVKQWCGYTVEVGK